MKHTKSLSSLNQFVIDSCQLMVDAAPTISNYPLQIYAGALIFSPTNSPVRQQYWKNTLTTHQTLKIEGLDADWGPILQPLENGMSSLDVGPICFSNDGAMIASTYYKAIIICDAYSGLCLQHIEVEFENIARALSFSPDGKFIACALNSGNIPIYDVLKGTMHDDGAKYCNLIHKHSNFSVARLEQNDTHLPGLENEHVWDAVTWKERKVTPLHKRERGQILHDWMVQKGNRPNSHIYGGPWMGRYGLETAWYEIFSADGKLVASPSPQDCILVWSAETGQLKCELKGHTDRIGAMEFSPNVKYLASADHKGLVNIWDIADDYQLLSSCDVSAHVDSHNNIEALAFSNSGKLLAVSYEVAIYVLNTVNGTVAVILDNIGIDAESLAFSPDELRLASKTGVLDLYLYIWTLGDLTQIGQRSSREVSTIDISTALGQLAIGYSDGTVELRDAATHSLVKVLRPSNDMRVSKVSFSRDGNRLACGLDYGQSVIIIDTGTNSVEFSCSSTKILDFSFCPSGKSIAIWHTLHALYNVALWDVDSGTICHVFPDSTGLDPFVSFSDDGNLATCTNGDGSTYIQIWDMSTMSLKAAFHDSSASHGGLTTACVHDNQSVVVCYHFSMTTIITNLKTGRIELRRRYKNFPQGLEWNMRASRDKTIMKTEFGPFDILDGDFCDAYLGEDINEAYVRDGWIVRRGKPAIYLPRRLGYEAELAVSGGKFRGKTFFYKGCLIIATHKRVIRVFQDLPSTG